MSDTKTNISLENLPTEVLFHIISYCNVQDLYNLLQTSHQFYRLIKHSIPNYLFGGILVTAQLTPIIKNKSKPLKCLEKLRLSLNWRRGRYTEKRYFDEKENFTPWLHLTNEHIYISRGSCVRAYKRLDRKLHSRPVVYDSETDSDISKFARTDNYLVAGLGNGQLCLWLNRIRGATKSKIFHQSEINTVDANNRTILSGSRDGEIYIWIVDDELNLDHRSVGSIPDKIWSSGFNPDGNLVAVGTCARQSVDPLYVLDPNRMRLPQKYGKGRQRGCGILDIKWLSNSTMLTCGYDSYVRKWDLRVGDCVREWSDPFQSTLYCMDTDRINTLLTGAQHNGRVVLYDMRQSNFVQLYFMKSTSQRRSSPVYSLTFEPRQLFVGTDRYLNVLDFTNSYKTAYKDYSDISSYPLIRC